MSADSNPFHILHEDTENVNRIFVSHLQKLQESVWQNERICKFTGERATKFTDTSIKNSLESWREMMYDKKQQGRTTVFPQG
ncbi:MAG: hypothetical protein LUG47_01190 [Clostridiales bacterium]|nr:hypothetical protein [Clostridiales bacterium]